MLTYSGWLTHISGHPSATGRAQDSESSPAKDRRYTAVPHNQYSQSWRRSWCQLRNILRIDTQDAQLSQRGGARRYVSWNLDNCWTTARNVTCWKACIDLKGDSRLSELPLFDKSYVTSY